MGSRQRYVTNQAGAIVTFVIVQFIVGYGQLSSALAYD